MRVAAAADDVLALLLDSVADYAIVTLDPNGVVATWGRGAERLYGFPAEEIVGEGYARLFLPQDDVDGKPVAALELALLHGRSEEEALRVRRDGSTFWANAVLTPLRNRDGALRGFAEVTRDVSARRQAEQGLQRLSDARSIVRARDEFLALAAHELKTPLTALGLNVQALQRAARRRPDEVMATLPHRTGKLQRHVERMCALVEMLLDVGRVASGRVELRLVPADLAGIAVAAITPLRADGRAARIRLDAPTPVPGRFDAQRVVQVVAALVDNALKYGGRAPVDVTVTHGGERGLVTVRDHGLGIGLADQERIFERFERAEPARQYGGFGFGLWSAREIVQAHGGEIRVRSKRGEGSTFEVDLPLEDRRR